MPDIAGDGVLVDTHQNGGDNGVTPTPAELRAANQANQTPQAVVAAADNAFWLNGPYNSTQAQAESYFQYLPDLTRGVMVPKGYPLDLAGLDLDPGNFVPAIVALPANVDPSIAMVQWTFYGSQGNAIDNSMTLAAFIALPGTVVSSSDANGNPMTWSNPGLAVVASYQPHIAFDSRYQRMKVFANPYAPYWDQQFNSWSEPSYALSVERFAAAVIVAVAVAYGLGAVDGTAATGGSTTAVSTVSTDTAAAAAPATTADAAPVSLTSGVDGSADALSTAVAGAGAPGSAITAGVSTSDLAAGGGAADLLESSGTDLASGIGDGVATEVATDTASSGLADTIAGGVGDALNTVGTTAAEQALDTALESGTTPSPGQSTPAIAAAAMSPIELLIIGIFFAAAFGV